MNNPPTIIGVETEYALAPVQGRASGASAGSATGLAPPDPQLRVRSGATLLIDRVRSQRPSLAGARAGLFLGNGARLYDDRGHVEYATPEARTPLEATAQVLAGDQLLFDALPACNGAAGERAGVGPLGLFNLNVDYFEGQCQTWGCHENYAYTGSGAGIGHALLPHLASRVILAGAGGFDPIEPLAFVLSPRAPIMTLANERPGSEAFFHPRTTSYSSESVGRLHLICGESLRSPRGIHLKLGSTAILVHLAQQGRWVGEEFEPEEPYQALCEFSKDLTGSVKVDCGDALHSAMEIQTALLELAEESLRAGRLPDWAGAVIDVWRESLDRLAKYGLHGLNRSFDFAIKRSIFEAHCRANGMKFSRLLAWNRPLRTLVQLSPPFAAALSNPQAAAALAGRSLRVECESLAGLKGESIPPWEELPRALALRLQLRELDWRFAQIGGGLFDRLDRAGLLQCSVPGLTPAVIERAVTHPPTQTRAATRAQIIQKWHATRAASTAVCDWNYVTDRARNRILRLDDLFPTTPRWRRIPVNGAKAAELFDTAIELYRDSRFHESNSILRRLRGQADLNPAERPREGSCLFRLLRYSAWVGSRLGSPDAVQFLDLIYGSDIDAASVLKVGDQLYCRRLAQLAPPPSMDLWILPAQQSLKLPPHSDEPLQGNVREHMGAWHLYRGELDEAEEMIALPLQECALWRRVRTHCLLADIQRRRGRADEARETLRAIGSQTTDKNALLVAEQILPEQAKLATDRAERIALLRNPARDLAAARHHVAHARVLLLMARDCRDPALAASILKDVRGARRRARGLMQCDLTSRILANWPAWTESAEADARGDLFWGL